MYIYVHVYDDACDDRAPFVKCRCMCNMNDLTTAAVCGMMRALPLVSVAAGPSQPSLARILTLSTTHIHTHNKTLVIVTVYTIHVYTCQVEMLWLFPLICMCDSAQRAELPL